MTEETLILDRSGRLVSPKHYEESLRGVEEPYMVFILEDLHRIRKKSQFSVLHTNVFENIAKYPVNVIAEGERVLNREDFVKEVQSLLTNKKVAWIDTGAVNFDWTDIHSLKVDVLSKLRSSPIIKAYVAIQRDDGKTDYISYTIAD